MPKATPMAEDQVRSALQELPDWSLLNGKLHREFAFRNFVDAFGFMTKVALEAEKLDHHPEWSNVWNKVVIDLVTHSAGNAISVWDVTLAKKIDAMA